VIPTDDPTSAAPPPFDIDTPPHAALRLLSNGPYRVFLAPAGTGFSEFGDLRLTDWRADRTADVHGYFLYLRDADSGEIRRVDGSTGAVREDGVITLRGAPLELDTRLDVAVAADRNVEVRRLSVANRSDRPRTIEVRSAVDVVLNAAAAHAAHPVFSRLFLQTDVRPEHRLLVARRRPRSPEEAFPVLFHAVEGGSDWRYETDRARFQGRPLPGQWPRLLATGQSDPGHVGNVLDPVLSHAVVLELAPGATETLHFLLGVAADADQAAGLVTALTGGAAIEELVAEAAASEKASRAARNLTRAAADRREADAGAELFGFSLESAPPIPTSKEPAPAAASGAAMAGARSSDSAAPESKSPGSVEPLRFDNGRGGFSADGTEYVVRMTPLPGGGLTRPPLPWTNVVANEEFGFLVSETGAGTTWCGNSREHRLTPWANDPQLDPAGEVFYLRDEETGRFWSPLAGPAPLPVPQEIRHGFGYSRARVVGEGLDQQTDLFVARHDPIRFTRIRVTNVGDRPRRLSAYACARLVMGHAPEDTARFLVTDVDPATGALMAENTNGGDFAGRVAFAAVVADGPLRNASHSGDRGSFLGLRGGAEAPAAVVAGGPLDGRTGAGLDPAFVQRVTIDIPAGGRADLTFLLGAAASREEARGLLAACRTPDDVERAFDRVRRFWAEGMSAIQIRTPSPALDLLVNGWIPYQVLSCRIWGRSAFYQSGGAFGFRDQLQDAVSLTNLWPDLARRQILLHAAHQFEEGDVLHWWHPPHDAGIRTRFADDLLWLPGLAADYVAMTADHAILDQVIPWVTARALEPGEDEAFLYPTPTEETDTLYTHCVRALDRSLAVGAHGLPLFGTGDWNDGMNRVGRLGRGESVWMGFFLYDILGRFLPHCEERGDDARAARYRAHRERLKSALDEGGWDGAWYRRGYYDSGAPLGSKESDECRIDALAQSWAVLSGAAPPERAAMAMDEVERQLISESDRLIRLLTPPFENTAEDPGYIKGYVAGVRENGGQYTHVAVWVVRAMAMLGRNNRAAALLDLINPVLLAATPEGVARYQVEPYVVPADVYGAPPHVGRGGWTWYTGSAGWMYRVALESILGLVWTGGQSLRLAPCIPDAWPEFSVRWRKPGGTTTWEIHAVNAARQGRGVRSVRVDGRPAPVVDGAALIELVDDGGTHRVELEVGAELPAAVVPR
jgi:N,N'-diacetylchitobiose phosphorylase